LTPEAPEPPGLLERIRDWRLPVRYRVPPRNDLIAFALMALAFGLMVGLAIAPGWGSADPTGPVIALPAPEPETGTTDALGSSAVANLQPPAGGEETTTASNDAAAVSGTPTSTADSTAGTGTPATTTSSETPADSSSPAENYTDGPANPPVDDNQEDAPDLKATVVGSDDSGYAVTDPAGNLLYVHFAHPASAQPKVGKRVGIGIDPVGNGTFLQSGALESLGTAATSKLNGVVSWIDPEAGVIVVSSRGVSIAVDAAAAMEKSASPPVLGSWVNATIAFKAASGSTAQAANTTEPASAEADAQVEEGDQPTGDDIEEEDPLSMPTITAKAVEAGGDPLTQLELAGPVTWDAAARVLTMAADSFGVLNREIPISIPKKLGLKNIEDGLAYAASADLGTTGTLTLAGLSANYSLAAAGDPNQAFGTHAR